MKDDVGAVWLASDNEKDRRLEFFELFKNCPIPGNEILANLGLFMNGPALTRILFMTELYQKILPIHGNIFELGVRWGQNLALWSECRALYEPFNHNRKIVGFDTFEGFPTVHEKDGGYSDVGDYRVIKGYEEYLAKILDFHEQENPIPHLKKHELVKGNAIHQLEKYLNEHPETIISLAYFDFDIYEPTKECLELIKPYLTKGSVIGFDELNVSYFPGETVAVREALGLGRYQITRSQYSRVNSYIVID